MRYFLDTEFSEKPGSIILLSIGIVAEDGREYYAVSSEFTPEQCNAWVQENVIPRLGCNGRKSVVQIAGEVHAFVANDCPEFWGYYCDYDWVVFCWLFGAMIDLPTGWPIYCRDLKQEIDRQERDISQPDDECHNALDDARWIAGTWKALSGDG